MGQRTYQSATRACLRLSALILFPCFIFVFEPAAALKLESCIFTYLLLVIFTSTLGALGFVVRSEF